jgi:hypothetical protein
MEFAEPIFVRGRDETFRVEHSMRAEGPANRAEWETDFGAAIREIRTLRGECERANGGAHPSPDMAS